MRTAVQAFVIAVCLLLVGGLVLTAIPKAREAADRANCKSKLTEIGRAIHNYSSTFGQVLPPACEPNPELPAERRLSWLLALAPYFQATDLYTAMDHAKGWDADENRYLALTRIHLLSCPSFPDRRPESTLVPTHYVGITGVGADAATLPLAHPRAGFFGYERELKVSDIADQRSTLLMVVETTRAHGAWTADGPATVRGLVEDDGPYLGLDRQFGGMHAGGVNVLFADGSVRLLREAIEPRVLAGMATIKGSKDAEMIREQ